MQCVKLADARHEQQAGNFTANGEQRFLILIPMSEVLSQKRQPNIISLLGHKLRSLEHQDIHSKAFSMSSGIWEVKVSVRIFGRLA